MARGQIFSMDFFAAVCIVMFTLGSATYWWMSMADRISSEVVNEEMEYSVFAISDALVRTPGIPENWEYNLTSAKVIGLSSPAYVVQGGKIDKLASLDYDTLKKLLGVGVYEVQIVLYDKNNVKIREIGTAPSQNTAFTARRPVVYNGNEAFLQTTVWRGN
ncbi:MAG: hypothetical protein NTU61_03670 [Candidatus Altiarchaeota archaeon]|nr:hypothetical protein [Candidatus Altiarchaeota archaeon]